ncbi:DUF2381 family protein [Archangium lipolyticum]|uniref:DUF2381 family protein n=1 Tax=Archangium lipolyticum TaxID=2970465 RepID=UPI002149CC45|nr:DUF2381 family protein [Archangium lipolyticum]
MRNLLLFRSALLLVLVATEAMAKEHEPVERSIYLSDHPRSEAPNVYVAGRIATILRFEQPCDPERTKMLGWEGRFEPLLVGGKSVVLVPLLDLQPEDRLLLLVTLSDGTELPFTVTSRKQLVTDRDGDQQINVFRDRKAPDAVLASLYDSLGRERELREEVERYRKEDSVDHALAALLLKGAVGMTPFLPRRSWVLKGDGVDMELQTFRSKHKAAVVFRITNKNPDESWKFREARLVNPHTGQSRPFALRLERDSISPGASGGIAVVADKSAFTSEEVTDQLVLQLFQSDGLQQAYVVLERPIGR